MKEEVDPTRLRTSDGNGHNDSNSNSNSNHVDHNHNHNHNGNGNGNPNGTITTTQNDLDQLIASFDEPSKRKTNSIQSISRNNLTTNQIQHQPPFSSLTIPTIEASSHPTTTNRFSDFFNFPDDSQSDDPDYEPPPSRPKEHHHRPSSDGHPAIGQHDPNRSQTITPADGLAPNLDWLSSSNPTHRSSTYPAHLLTTTNDHLLDQIGFDFSTLSDLPPHKSIDHQPHRPSIDHHPSLTRSDNKLSPLTQGEIAGVPFVNINLPDSDDSPEFIPPIPIPPSISPRPSKRPRRASTTDRHPHQNHRHPHQPQLPLPGPSNTTSSSALKQSAPKSLARHPSSIDHRQPTGLDRTIKLPTSISNRYIAIAPNPYHPSSNPAIEERNKIQKRPTYLKVPSQDEFETDMDDHDDEDDDEIQTYSTSKVNLPNQGPANRSRPEPKPKKSHPNRPVSDPSLRIRQPATEGISLEDPVKRKRDAMRKARERKKLYIISLEDRCLELAEENARLREENSDLIRESRENWKSKAKSLEVFKQLNQQIQQLQKQQPSQNLKSTRPRSRRGGSEPDIVEDEDDEDEDEDDPQTGLSSSTSTTINHHQQQLKRKMIGHDGRSQANWNKPIEERVKESQTTRRSKLPHPDRILKSSAASSSSLFGHLPPPSSSSSSALSNPDAFHLRPHPSASSSSSIRGRTLLDVLARKTSH